MLARLLRFGCALASLVAAACVTPSATKWVPVPETGYAGPRPAAHGGFPNFTSIIRVRTDTMVGDPSLVGRLLAVNGDTLVVERPGLARAEVRDGRTVVDTAPDGTPVVRILRGHVARLDAEVRTGRSVGDGAGEGFAVGFLLAGAVVTYCDDGQYQHSNGLTCMPIMRQPLRSLQVLGAAAAAGAFVGALITPLRRDVRNVWYPYDELLPAWPGVLLTIRDAAQLPGALKREPLDLYQRP